MKLKKHLVSQRNMEIRKNKYFYMFALIVLTFNFNGSLQAQNKDKAKEVNVSTFKKSSKTDHEMIQKAIDYASTNNINTVIIPDGEYQIDVTSLNGIALKSNIHLKLDDNAVLKALPSNSSHTIVVRVHDVENVIISGGKVVGERYEHIGTTGEWGMGIDIKNSTNVELRDISASDCWGDGVYIAAPGSKDVLMSNVICDNNRRQGMTVIAVDGFIIKDCVFKNTNGTAPEAGIDFEPNDSTQIAQNILIENTKFLNNAGIGLHLYGWFGPTTNVKVVNCILDNNPIGIDMEYKGIYNIEFSNLKISNCKTQGMRILEDVKDLKMSQISITGSRWGNAITIFGATNIELTNFDVDNYTEGLIIKDSKNIKLKSINMNSSFAKAKSRKTVEIINSSNVSMIDFNMD